MSYGSLRAHGVREARGGLVGETLRAEAMSGEVPCCTGTGELWIFSEFSGGPVCPECRGVPAIIDVTDPGRAWFITTVPAHAPHRRK